MNPTVGRPEQRPALTRDVRRVLAVVAHPDDESFGLGAVLDRFVSCGIDTSVLCFTHGEASTLRPRDGDLATVRASELRAAAMTLGTGQVELLDYPDGRLDQTPVADLAVHVTERISRWQPSHLLVFDEGGVTGHPDHRQATRAALSAAVDAGLPVLAWTIPDQVAAVLNARHGTTFTGRPDSDIDARLSISRTRQAARHRRARQPVHRQPGARAAAAAARRHRTSPAALRARHERHRHDIRIHHPPTRTV